MKVIELLTPFFKDMNKYFELDDDSEKSLQERYKKMLEETENLISGSKNNDIKREFENLRQSVRDDTISSETYNKKLLELSKKQYELNQRILESSNQNNTLTPISPNEPNTFELPVNNTGVDMNEARNNALDENNRLSQLRLEGNNLLNSNIGDKLKGLISEPLENALGNLNPFGGSGLGGSIGKVLGKAGPWGMAIAALSGVIIGGFQAGYEELSKNNEALIETQRKSGGILNEQITGVSAMGKVAQTGKYFNRELNRANISLEQFTETLGAFASEGMGNLIGVADLKQQTGAIRNLGVEGARIKKLYNADIIPAIRGLFRDWGQDSITDLKSIMVDGVRQAKLEGIDPGEFAKNMAKVVQMSDKLTFKNGVKGMKQLAMLSTRLGVDVNEIAGGFTELKSFTDIYQKQNELSNLGLRSYAMNIGQIFAQRQTGDTEGAVNTEITSLAKDLLSSGNVYTQGENKGLLTVQGKQIAEAVGLNAEQMKAIEKVTRYMTKLGLSAEEAVKPIDEMSEQNRKLVLQMEKTNMTLEESWTQTKQEFSLAWSNFWGSLLEGPLKKLSEWLGGKVNEKQAGETRKEAISILMSQGLSKDEATNKFESLQEQEMAKNGIVKPEGSLLKQSLKFTDAFLPGPSFSGFVNKSDNKHLSAMLDVNKSVLDVINEEQISNIKNNSNVSNTLKKSQSILDDIENNTRKPKEFVTNTSEFNYMNNKAPFMITTVIEEMIKTGKAANEIMLGQTNLAKQTLAATNKTAHYAGKGLMPRKNQWTGILQ